MDELEWCINFAIQDIIKYGTEKHYVRVSKADWSINYEFFGSVQKYESVMRGKGEGGRPNVSLLLNVSKSLYILRRVGGGGWRGEKTTYSYFLDSFFVISAIMILVVQFDLSSFLERFSQRSKL